MRWMTFDLGSGWEEHDTLRRAQEAFDWVLDELRGEEWDEEGVDRIGVWELHPIRTARLVTTATAEDDSEDGETCRERGWQCIAEAVVDDHTSPAVELERVKRLLAVEVGDVSALPEHWKQSGSGDAYNGSTHLGHEDYVHRIARGRWSWVARDRAGKRMGSGECRTALEAMEAADAAWVTM